MFRIQQKMSAISGEHLWVHLVTVKASDKGLSNRQFRPLLEHLGNFEVASRDGKLGKLGNIGNWTSWPRWIKRLVGQKKIMMRMMRCGGY